jgi:hypothetical protein
MHVFLLRRIGSLVVALFVARRESGTDLRARGRCYFSQPILISPSTSLNS